MKFVTGKAIQARLAPAVSIALGIPDADVPLWAAELEHGWLIATYKRADGSLTRYALPPGAVLYVRQDVTADEIGANPPAPAVL